jgi:hypothetical protein
MHGLALNWQCGQGSTDDEMSPCHVATLVGLPVSGVAAGLWHTLCITDSGDVYACGGNQFGQLGVGGDHAEVWVCSLHTLIDVVWSLYLLCEVVEVLFVPRQIWAIFVDMLNMMALAACRQLGLKVDRLSHQFSFLKFPPTFLCRCFQDWLSHQSWRMKLWYQLHLELVTVLFSQVGVTMWHRLPECLPSLLFTSKKQVDAKA